MPRILPRGTGLQPVLSGQHGLQTGATKKQTPKPAVASLGRLCFATPVESKKKPEWPKKPGGEKLINDPKLVAAARELRDRWLERVNAPGGRGSAI